LNLIILNLIKMAYLVVKAAVLALVVVSALSVVPRSDAYSNIEVQTCCPEGFNEAGVYCVKCTAPKFWNPTTMRC